MLKKFCKYAALTALIAYPILFWIWKSYGFPIDVNTCQTGANGQCDYYAPEHIYLFVFGKIGEAFSDSLFITALATVLLAFITGGLVVVGYLQIRTTRAQLRAYVIAHVIDSNAKPGRFTATVK